MKPNLEQQLDTNLFIPESAWVVDDHPDEQEMQMLREHLSEYNAVAANSREGWRLALFLHDEQGNMMGRICGRFWGECPEIDTLFLYDRSGETERLFTPLRFTSADRAKSAIAGFYDA